MAKVITSEDDLNRVAPPRLPSATQQYDRRYQEQLNSILRLYFSQLSNNLGQLNWATPIDYLDFKTTAPDVPHAHLLGRVNWDVPDACLEIDLEYGVVQQVGQELYARVRNSTGVAIPNGTAVGFAGAAPDALNVAPYIANGTSPTVYILGVMTHDLPNSGEKGYCTTFGFVRDLDTTGTPYGETWAEGDVLYASPSVAGGLTKVKPTAPDNVIIMAAVTTVSATEGIIFVRPTVTEQMYYGTFARTTSYSPAVANTAYAIPFNSTIIANGVSIGTPTSRIVVAQSGFYSITCTLQYSSSTAAAKIVYAWIRKNGTDIPQSSRLVSVDTNGGYRLGVVNEPISLAANDYIEIMVAVTNITATLAAVGATAFAPGSPAASLTIQQIQQ